MGYDPARMLIAWELFAAEGTALTSVHLSELRRNERMYIYDRQSTGLQRARDIHSMALQPT